MLGDFISEKQQLFSTEGHTELRAQENRQRRINLVQGNLTTNDRTETSGVCARVYKNGVYGFSSMAECSGQAAERVLKAATENAIFMDRHIGKEKRNFPAIPSGNVLLNKEVSDTEQKRYIKLVAVSKETVADGGKVLPYMAFKNVVIAGK